MAATPLRLPRLMFGVACVGFALLGNPLMAQQVDVIRGRVIGPDSVAVSRATITVTSVSGGVARNARTDANGRFTVTFPGGDGDYIVAIAAIGFAAKSFEIKRTVDDDVLIANAKLSAAAVRLNEVHVSAPRDRAIRNDATPDIGGTERSVVASAVSVEDLGDLASLAASVPGVLFLPGADGGAAGFSVFGLSADQNSVTLNGMNFGGSNVPRDAAVTATLATAPYDVARGGFSGGQLSVRSQPGSNYSRETASLVLNEPGLEWTDAAARALGQEFTSQSLGGLFSGPIALDHSFYNFSYQLGRRTSGLRTLLNTDPLGLQTVGIAPDSVAVLLRLLNQAQIPVTVGGPQRLRENDQGQIFGSFDVAPPSSRSGQAINLTYSAGWSSLSPVSANTTELPAHSGDATNWNGTVQGRHSAYFGFGILSETGISFSESHSSSSPFLLLPAGIVFVNSVLTDGSAGTQTAQFGGGSALSNSRRAGSVDLTNQLSWFSEGNEHRIKLTSELRHDTYSAYQATNLLGTFYFNSLADLAANQPTEFNRQFAPSLQHGGQLTGGLSLGDSYRPSSNLQIQYGVRVDGNSFDSPPPLNPAISQIFGTSNDHAPSGAYVSPRIGFSWKYGIAPQVSAFQGAAAQPRGIVRGGIGVFQNLPVVSLLSGAMSNSGLPGAVQQLTCVGPAAPTPDWSAYAADSSNVPSECSSGSSNTVFASTVPNVQLLSRTYRPPRSLRSNLQWSGPLLGNRLSAMIDASYSLSTSQSRIVDLNFDPTVRFTLPDEASRPVFVQPTSISPRDGVVAASDGRISQLFDHVGELRSDVGSYSRQISVRFSPATFSSELFWNIGYVYANTRDEAGGFASTAGNPLSSAWAPSALASTHQVTYGVSYNFFDWVRVNWTGSFRSGLRFTPLIASDVNGDGYANDRAFIFDPARTSDPNVAASMRSLLSSASGSIRGCLQAQVGRLADRNSCVSAWTSSAVLSFSLNSVKFGMPQRATVTFQVGNPLGALDILLHGENNLQGWGQPVVANPYLLYVTGFNPQTLRYQYAVNPRFGSTSLAYSAFRAPVTVSTAIRFDFGATRERQSLTRQLDRGRRSAGVKISESMLRVAYASGGIPNPLASILQQGDSLHLTKQQLDSIALLNRLYVIRLDSIWSPVARYLATLPDAYDVGAVYSRYRAARETSVDLLLNLAPRVMSLLAPDQRRRLPASIAVYLDRRYLLGVRSSTAGLAPNLR